MAKAKGTWKDLGKRMSKPVKKYKTGSKGIKAAKKARGW